MNSLTRAFCLAVAVTALLAGCKTGYTWRPSVPGEMRTVSVPTFRNESNLTELGTVMATQLLREFQREGTFAIRSVGDSALEVQGVVKSASARPVAYDRRAALRQAAYELNAVVEVSVIDKRAGKVLVDNRRYRALSSFSSDQDISTSERDASGRLADDLARQVVDDVLNMKW